MMEGDFFPEPRQALSRQDLFEAFKKQLSKDFEQSNLPSDFVNFFDADYINIREKIAEEIQRNQGKTSFNLMQLLYRIDISEAQLKKYMDAKANENYFRVLAELIIKRVLQKVVIRRFYKSNETNTS